MNVVPVAGLLPTSIRMRFTGTEASLFRILLRGSLLQIPTFSFYRFWLTTDVRRHLWSHAEVGEDSFEYTGRAKELLIGFLIALAVIVPINIVYFAVTLEVERWRPFASIPLVLLFYAFGYYAIFRARRYRATRTVFRGVRFWMVGSGWAYLGRAALWDILTLLTLGFAYSWRSAALEGYKMRNSRYGNLEGDFVSRGWTLFKRGAWIWALYLLTAVIIGIFAALQYWASAILFAVIFLVGSFFLLPIFQAIELRWWLDGIRFGPVTVTSDLTVGAVLKCYFKTIGFWMIYSMVGGVMISLIFGIGAAIGTMTIGPINDATALMAHLPLLIAGAVIGSALYVVFLLGFNLIRRLFFDRGVWAAAVNSVTLWNFAAVDQVVSAGGEVPSGLGEGLLDALDIGGGV